ncbi:MAG: riboflavin synthase, partial [Spirosomataceae bacterium]
IVPYTWEHTNIHLLKVGSSVNLEFDILGKYMQRILSEKLR